MKLVATNRNFVMLTLTIFTLAMGFNFVQLLGSYIPIFYVFGGDKVAGATLLGINGTIWAITGVLAVFPLNWISPKLGKRNTLTITPSCSCAWHNSPRLSATIPLSLPDHYSHRSAFCRYAVFLYAGIFHGGRYLR